MTGPISDVFDVLAVGTLELFDELAAVQTKFLEIARDRAVDAIAAAGRAL